MKKLLLISLNLFFIQSINSGCFSWCFPKKIVTKKIIVKPACPTPLNCDKVDVEVIKNMLSFRIHIDDSSAETLVTSLARSLHVITINKKLNFLGKELIKKIIKEKKINFKKFGDEPLYIATKNSLLCNAYNETLQAQCYKHVANFLKTKGLKITQEDLEQIKKDVNYIIYMDTLESLEDDEL